MGRLRHFHIYRLLRSLVGLPSWPKRSEGGSPIRRYHLQIRELRGLRRQPYAHACFRFRQPILRCKFCPNEGRALRYRANYQKRVTGIQACRRWSHHRLPYNGSEVTSIRPTGPLRVPGDRVPSRQVKFYQEALGLSISLVLVIRTKVVCPTRPRFSRRPHAPTLPIRSVPPDL